MNNVGLNVFIAIVGITTGPSFVRGFQEVGWSLFLVGAVATTIPLVAGIFIGKYLFRFNEAIVLGCVSGPSRKPSRATCPRWAIRSPTP